MLSRYLAAVPAPRPSGLRRTRAHLGRLRRLRVVEVARHVIVNRLLHRLPVLQRLDLHSSAPATLELRPPASRQRPIGCRADTCDRDLHLTCAASGSGRRGSVSLARPNDGLEQRIRAATRNKRRGARAATRLLVHQVEVLRLGREGRHSSLLAALAIQRVVVVEADDGGHVADQRVAFGVAAPRCTRVAAKERRDAAHERRFATACAASRTPGVANAVVAAGKAVAKESEHRVDVAQTCCVAIRATGALASPCAIAADSSLDVGRRPGTFSHPSRRRHR